MFQRKMDSLVSDSNQKMRRYLLQKTEAMLRYSEYVTNHMVPIFEFFDVKKEDSPMEKKKNNYNCTFL